MAHDHRSTGSGRLSLALTLVAVFLVVEVVVGVLSHSVALLADAAHMLTDAAGLAGALVAARLARRPSGGSLTFGLRRLEVLAAQGNGALLAVVGVLVAVEAVRRLVHPATVDGWSLVVVAGVGIVVNVAVALVLSRGASESMNVSAALAHAVADGLAAALAVVAGVVIVTTGFDRADPIASLVVVCVVLATAARVLWRTGRVLLEAAPEGIAPEQVAASMTADPRVDSVHELHLWLISSGFPALSAHVLVRPGFDCHRVREDVEQRLADAYGIAHTTLQVEHANEAVLTIAARQPEDGSVGC